MERYLSIPLWGDPPAFSTSLWLRVSVAGSPKLRMLRTRPGLTWGNATHSSHGRPSRSQRIIVNPTSKPRYRSTYRGQRVGALSGVAFGAGAMAALARSSFVLRLRCLSPHLQLCGARS